MQIGKLTAMALAGVLFATPAALAQDGDGKLIPGDFTGSVTFTTDYVFRGISQTDEGPAVQGSLDYTYMFRPEIGIYVGIFGSNVDFDEASGPGVDKASAEFDLYGGVKGDIGGVLWQLGVIRYTYPQASPSADFDYDFTEIVAKLGYDFGVASVTGGINYADDYFSETGESIYLSADVTVPLPFLPFDIAALGHIGHQSIENNGRFGAPDYTDWLVGVSGQVEGFTLTLSYVGTDIDDDECFAGSGLTGTCDSRFTFAVSRSF